MPEDLPYIADSYSCIAVSYTVVVIVTSTLDSAVLLNWRGSSKSGEVATETRTPPIRAMNLSLETLMLRHKLNFDGSFCLTVRIGSGKYVIYLFFMFRLVNFKHKVVGFTSIHEMDNIMSYLGMAKTLWLMGILTYELVSRLASFCRSLCLICLGAQIKFKMKNNIGN